MRLWSLHPSLLDAKGLVALWREALLAQKVLLGQTKGYRHHPQLRRFSDSTDPCATIAAYLWGVVDESRARDYTFDSAKIAVPRSRVSLPVTRGQLEYELEHLRAKLRVRDRAAFRRLKAAKLRAHPIFRITRGGVAPWEIT